MKTKHADLQSSLLTKVSAAEGPSDNCPVVEFNPLDVLNISRGNMEISVREILLEFWEELRIEL